MIYLAPLQLASTLPTYASGWTRGVLAMTQLHVGTTIAGNHFRESFESVNGHSGLVTYGPLGVFVKALMTAEATDFRFSARVKVRPVIGSMDEYERWKLSLGSGPPRIRRDLIWQFEQLPAGDVDTL